MAPCPSPCMQCTKRPGKSSSNRLAQTKKSLPVTCYYQNTLHKLAQSSRTNAIQAIRIQAFAYTQPRSKCHVPMCNHVQPVLESCAHSSKHKVPQAMSASPSVRSSGKWCLKHGFGERATVPVQRLESHHNPNYIVQIWELQYIDALRIQLCFASKAQKLLACSYGYSTGTGGTGIDNMKILCCALWWGKVV